MRSATAHDGLNDWESLSGCLNQAFRFTGACSNFTAYSFSQKGKSFHDSARIGSGYCYFDPGDYFVSGFHCNLPHLSNMRVRRDAPADAPATTVEVEGIFPKTTAIKYFTYCTSFLERYTAATNALPVKFARVDGNANERRGRAAGMFGPESVTNFRVNRESADSWTATGFPKLFVWSLFAATQSCSDIGELGDVLALIYSRLDEDEKKLVAYSAADAAVTKCSYAKTAINTRPGTKLIFGTHMFDLNLLGALGAFWESIRTHCKSKDMKTCSFTALFNDLVVQGGAGRSIQSRDVVKWDSARMRTRTDAFFRICDEKPVHLLNGQIIA